MDKDVSAADGMTPMHLAASNGRVEAVQVLLEKGAAKDAVTSVLLWEIQHLGNLVWECCINMYKNTHTPRILYIHTCIYIYIHICVYTYIYTYTAYTYTYTFTCIYLYIYLSIHPSIYLSICTYIHTYIHRYIDT